MVLNALCSDVEGLAGSELARFVYPVVETGALRFCPLAKAVSSCEKGLPDSGQESYSASSCDDVGNGSIIKSA